MNPLDLPPDEIPDLESRLTPRQLQIVELIARGKRIEEITYILSISRSTVRNHITHIFKRLDIDNRLSLVVLYVRWKMKAP